ncbi:MAG: hypothetical protein AB7R89_13910 [Dehalococcoidia bacterium]
MKETLAFHVTGTRSDEFERNLAEATENCEGDGYEVVDIEHQSHLAVIHKQVSIDRHEAQQVTFFSAVVRCQRETTDE